MKRIEDLLIIHKSESHLKLNESESTVDGKKKYILEGIFGVIGGGPNRNGRIYDEEEYLPHLKELRDDIQNDIPILGELDHPDDRFEVKLQNVSHRVIDLWYDKPNSVIRGKLEILNTPAGEIVKSLIDQKVPIFVSSRAAGQVKENNHVTIQKLFTYDIVPRPGFAEARVELVNESAKSLLSSLKHNTKKHNVSKRFHILDESVAVYEINNNTKMVESDKKSVESGLTSHSSNIEQFDSDKSLSSAGIPVADTSTIGSSDSEPDKPKFKVKSKGGKNAQKSEKKESSEILSVEAEFDENLIVSVEAEFEKDLPEKEAKKKKLDKVEKKSDKELEDTTDSVDDVLEKYDNIIEKASKKKALKESVNSKYPWTKFLSPFDLAHFINVPEDRKSAINESFYETPGLSEYMASYHDLYSHSDNLIAKSYSQFSNEVYESKVEDPKWLSHAPGVYRTAFNNLDDMTKDSIAATAEVMIFENQNDIDSFWYNTGIVSQDENNIAHKRFITSVPEIARLNESDFDPMIPNEDYFRSLELAMSRLD